MTNQFLHLSNHTINPTQISYIDWNYREGSGDTPFIRIIVGYEDILLGVDSLDSKVLSDYIESTKTKREPTKAGITVDDLPDTKTNNQFINFSTHTVRLASIDLIDWDYRDSGDTPFIRVVVGCEVILLNADGEDAGILYEYGLKGELGGFSKSLTKREQFAAIALQGLLANGVHRLSPADLCTIDFIGEKRFAEVAIWMADALIAKLEAK